jgi:hypothetical protein
MVQGLRLGGAIRLFPIALYGTVYFLNSREKALSQVNGFRVISF